MSVIMGPFLDLAELILDVYFNIVILEVILHWLIHFNLLELSNKYTQKVMEVLEKLTQPVYDKIRQRVPPISGLDFSPFILVLGIYFLSSIIHRLNILVQ